VVVSLKNSYDRTKRWKGLGSISAFRGNNFLTGFNILINAVGLLCPAPQLCVLSLAKVAALLGKESADFFLEFGFCLFLEAVCFVSFQRFPEISAQKHWIVFQGGLQFRKLI